MVSPQISLDLIYTEPCHFKHFESYLLFSLNSCISLTANPNKPPVSAKIKTTIPTKLDLKKSTISFFVKVSIYFKLSWDGLDVCWANVKVWSIPGAVIPHYLNTEQIIYSLERLLSLDIPKKWDNDILQTNLLFRTISLYSSSVGHTNVSLHHISMPWPWCNKINCSEKSTREN